MSINNKIDLYKTNPKEPRKEIGPFSLKLDEEINTEVLDSSRVYDDLASLDLILGKNDMKKSEAGAKGLMEKQRRKN